ncbi:MAG: 4-(cytidine 5'-diphospho)-2-C-methyl-D-erythritol kinase, partial [Burkholderiales bacterium]|nr:4-(cytidine 5'-diphospho)-2-C-methyl-D-erythritol kinase [Burkholderiales bacterium]
MNPQVFPAPAKLNLFLHVTGQRSDGYHLLQTVFRFIDYGDTVSLSPRADGQIVLTHPLPGVPPEKDLCYRAARLLQTTTETTQGVDITLEKRLPLGGGLGGGSSDAATVLLALNRLWQLNLSRNELLKLGLQLGADVPFFIYGSNAWAEGVGEALQTINLIDAYYVVLTPNAHV